MARTRSDKPQRQTGRTLDRRLLSLGVFLLLALPTVFSWVVSRNQARTFLRTQTEITGAAVSNRLADHLNLRWAIVKSLSHEMSSGKAWTQEEFTTRAEQLCSTFPDFKPSTGSLRMVLFSG